MATGPRAADVARLLMQHRHNLYAFIYSCVQHHSDAEDLLQITSMAAMESFSQLRDEAGFLPWAREIARRRILAHRRTSKKEQSFDPELVQVMADAAERIEEKDTATPRHLALLQCLDGLPPGSKELIIQRYTEQKGDADRLAEQYGHSIQSIYARIKRIKIALRDCVEKRLSEAPH